LRDGEGRYPLYYAKLKVGGAERVTLNILNSLDSNIFNISLLLFQMEGDLLSILRDGIKIYTVGSERVSIGIFKTLYMIYRLKPKIVYSEYQT